MASAPDPARRRWRPAGTSTPRRTLSTANWRRAGSSPSPLPTRTRRIGKIVLGTLAALACYVAAFEVVRWFSPLRPVGLHIVETGYLTNLAVPPNPRGLFAAEAFAALTSPTPPWFRWGLGGFGAVEPVTLAGNVPWNRNLNQPNSTVILYFAGQGGGDAAGAFLLRDVERMLDDVPTTDNFAAIKLNLEQVIQTLIEARRTNYLLVLDVAKAPANPAIGLLKNDFDRQLEALESRIAAAGNLVVLAPRSSARTSWSAEIERRSGFGHFVVKGLKGAARGAGGRIDATSLARYVGKHLDEQDPDAQEPAGAAALSKLIFLPASGPIRRLTLAQGSSTPATDPTPTPVDPTPAAKAPLLWDRYNEHAATSPEAYAPHLWRWYRDTLVRHQTLDRFLTPPTAGVAEEVAQAQATLAKQLTKLDAELKAARQTHLASADLSLAMPAAEGPNPAPAVDQLDQFQQVWADPTKAGAITARNPRPFYDLLLTRVETAASPLDFDRAAQVLAGLPPLGPSRPAEVLLLAILLQESPPGLFDSTAGRSLVTEALQVRRLGERVALGVAREPTSAACSYTEQIAPVVEALVTAGDRERRQAEDLLFAADTSSHDRAALRLAAARAQYAEADALATKLRPALAARDQAFADLPYYAQWALRSPTPASFAQYETIEDAWGAAHNLAGLLGPPFEWARVDAETDRVVRSLATLRATLAREVQTRIAEPASAGSRVASLALLDTPLVSRPADRARLRQKLADSVYDDPIHQTEDEVIRAAAWQGRLALAALGQDWIDSAESVPPEALKEPRDSFRKIRDQLAGLDAGLTGFKEDEISRAEVALTRIGSRIGQAQRALGAAIRARVASTAGEPLLNWPKTLQAADRLERTLLGAQAAPLLGATAAYRDRLLQRLLLRQAGRALDDHWFAEGDDPELASNLEAKPPYYQIAAQTCLDDLKTIAGKLDVAVESDPELIRLRLDLKQPTRLVVRGPATPMVITDEPAVPVRYAVEAVPGATRGLDGQPVAWIHLGGEQQVRLDDPATATRCRVAIGSDSPSAPVDERASPTESIPPALEGSLRFGRVEQVINDPESVRRPEVVAGRFDFEGRYRGQVLRQPTRFEIHPVPQILVRQAPLPATGAVAIDADPGLLTRYGVVREGALAIVLDCSGSMRLPEDAAAGTPSKYGKAVEALRQILQRVTPGTRVSLWVFGEAIGPGRTTDRPSQTIRQVLPATAWRADDAALLGAVIRLVEPPAIEPWNESPIIEAMIRAKADLRGVPGFKTMVVLTDGQDNCFGRDTPPGRPKPEIPQALTDAFRDTEIEINVIGYKVEAEGEVRKQFRVIESLNPRGHFYPINQADVLGDTLAAAFRPTLQYSVQTLSNILIQGAVELSNSQAEMPTFQRLPPGHSKLVVETGGIRSERPLTVHRGDHLIVRLTEVGRRITMNRQLWTETMLANPPPWQDLGEWRLAAIQNRLGPRRSLLLKSTLENLPDSQETALELVRPQELWMEVEPAGNEQAPFQQRWERVSGKPALLTELTVPAWPDVEKTGEAAKPRVKAYWDPDARAVPIVALARNEVLPLPNLRRRQLPTPQGLVVIESIKVEPMGNAKPTARSALFVRASFPKQKRFWVRPTGINPAWAEHRLYTDAGKYTGVFWPLTEEEVDQFLTGLALISVDDFCQRAKERGFAIEKFDAKVPSPTDPGPEEVGLDAILPPVPALPSSGSVLR